MKKTTDCFAIDERRMIRAMETKDRQWVRAMETKDRKPAERVVHVRVTKVPQTIRHVTVKMIE